MSVKMKISNDDKAKYYIIRIDSGLTHHESILKTFEWVRWLEEN